MTTWHIDWHNPAPIENCTKNATFYCAMLLFPFTPKKIPSHPNPSNSPPKTWGSWLHHSIHTLPKTITVCTAKKNKMGLAFLISFLLGAKKKQAFLQRVFPSQGASSSSLPPHSAKSLRLDLRRPARAVGEGWKRLVGEGWGNETRIFGMFPWKTTSNVKVCNHFWKLFYILNNHGSRTSTKKSHKLLIYKIDKIK